jgi:hypothetical protein
VLLALVAGGALRAEEPAHAPGTDEPPPDLGIKLAAVPIVGYGSDEGFGFGAHFKFTDFGVGTRKPFVYSLEGNAFTSSKGIKSYWVAVDVPEFAGSPYRVTLRTAYSQSRFQPYYGLGNGSVRDPDATRCPTEVLEAQLPGAPNTCPAGGGQLANPAFRGFRFYEYDLLSFPSLQLTVLRSLGGPWSVLVGYQFLFAGFQPTYSPDDLGQNTGSQLSIDAAAGRLVGWNGRPVPGEPYHRFVQRYAELAAGVRFDTRDNEFAPTRGMFHEASVRGAAHFLGSESNAWGANVTVRFYLRPVPSYWRLVFALRVLGDVSSSGLPFYRLPFTGGISQAGQLNGPEVLGGRSSIRGLTLERYQGAATLLGNAELRWRFVNVGEFELGTVLALDAGRVWARLGDSDVGTIHVGGAAGLRIAWSHHLIIRVDFGLAPELQFHLDFGELF